MTSKIFSPFNRWILSTSAIAFLAAYYIWFGDALGVLFAADHSEIALGLIALIVATIAYIGVAAFKYKDPTPNIFGQVSEANMSLDPPFFVAELCMGIGLLGTIMGMMSVLGVFDTMAASQTKQMISTIGAGVGAAQVTIFSGILGSIIIRCVMGLTFGTWFRRGE